MERCFEEKVKEMSVKELERFLERGRIYALSAAKEGLERFKRGDGKIGQRFFILILRAKNGEIKGLKEIKKRAAQILKERFFDEKSILEIIECDDLETKEREGAAKKYLQLGGEDKYLLKRIAESNLSKETKNLAVEKIIQLGPTKDELISILTETTDLTSEKTLELLLKEKLEKEDYCYLIMNCQTEIAKKIFEKMKREVKIDDLEEEDFEDLRLCEDQKISRWAIKKEIKKLKEEKRKLKEKMKSTKDPEEKNSIWWEIHDISEKIESLKKELKGEKKIKTEIESPALFFISIMN